MVQVSKNIGNIHILIYCGAKTTVVKQLLDEQEEFL